MPEEKKNPTDKTNNPTNLSGDITSAEVDSDDEVIADTQSEVVEERKNRKVWWFLFVLVIVITVNVVFEITSPGIIALQFFGLLTIAIHYRIYPAIGAIYLLGDVIRNLFRSN